MVWVGSSDVLGRARYVSAQGSRMLIPVFSKSRTFRAVSAMPRELAIAAI